jgi:Ni,Fe-hydrogenase III large subunit
MHPNLPANSLCVNAQETLSISELFALMNKALEAKNTLVSLWGRAAQADEAPGVVVTALWLTPEGLRLARGHAQPGEAVPSLTARHPAAQAFERELWEQTGLVPEGHPWLKPMRYEGERQRQMDQHPFFQLRGPNVHEVGVGPIHAGVIEPGHFRFMCHGETVEHLEIQLGYQHRGVEALLRQRPPHLSTPLVESIAGDSVMAYAWAHAAALEALWADARGAATRGHDDEATQASRAVGLELERVAMHLATLTGLVTDVAYGQPAGTYQRLRTAIINASQRVCGNRFGRGWVRPGRAAPLTPALHQDLLATLQAFQTDFEQVNHLVTASRSVQARLQGVGTVSPQAAQDLGLSGVVARASGLPLDLRQQHPHGLYAHHPVDAVTQAQAPTVGDCWSRCVQRMREAEASTRWLIDRLQAPEGAEPSDAARTSGAAPDSLPPHRLAVGWTEGVRGPVLVALETDAHGALRHVKVQDPSLANWFGLAWALRGQQISDFPICNKSFDLSYCGNDL